MDTKQQKSNDQKAKVKNPTSEEFKADNDNHGVQLNPNNSKFVTPQQANDARSNILNQNNQANSAAQNNRSNQMNPNNRSYSQSRSKK